jgi:flagellar biosynthesis anti-sigma factor FlgM
MEIQGDRPLDPAARRRQAEAARAAASSDSGAQRAEQPGATFTASDSASVARLVEIVTQMNTSDLQRVDELRERIADGRYRADPQELADLLLGRGRER